MQVKSIAECYKRSILQYFRPSLSYNLSLRSLFCLFLSGRFTQVLLYALFFDCKGIVAKVPVPEGGRDKEVLDKDLIMLAVVEHFITACPHMAMCGIKLLHDSRGPFSVW